jgi:hypothetical protein
MDSVVVTEFISLEGVIEDPGGAEGGWDGHLRVRRMVEDVAHLHCGR